MSYRYLAIVLATTFALTRPASAEDRGLAVLVGASEGDSIVLKISDELRALGFEVEVALPGSDREQIRGRARHDDAVTVVVVDEREIEVRVVAAGDVHLRRFQRRPESDTGTSALAAVEVVRGYLVPVETSSRAAPTAETPAAMPSTERKPRSFSARVSGGSLSAGNYPTQGAITLGVAKHFGRIGIEVSALAALPRADAWNGGLGVAVQYAPLGYTRPVSFAVGGGVAGLAIAYREDAKKYALTAAAVPHVDLVGRVVISGSFAARVDGMLGLALPSPVFKSKTESDVRFGSTIASLSAGVEVAW